MGVSDDPNAVYWALIFSSVIFCFERGLSESVIDCESYCELILNDYLWEKNNEEEKD